MPNWTENLVTIYGDNLKELDSLYINLVKEREHSKEKESPEFKGCYVCCTLNYLYYGFGLTDKEIEENDLYLKGFFDEVTRNDDGSISICYSTGNLSELSGVKASLDMKYPNLKMAFVWRSDNIFHVYDPTNKYYKYRYILYIDVEHQKINKLSYSKEINFEKEEELVDFINELFTINLKNYDDIMKFNFSKYEKKHKVSIDMYCFKMDELSEEKIKNDNYFFVNPKIKFK